MWNAERILQNYIKFANDSGLLVSLEKDSPDYKEQQQFLAAMRAYGKDTETMFSVPFSGILSESVSATKEEECLRLVGEYLKPEQKSSPDYFDLFHPNRIGLRFTALFIARKNLPDHKPTTQRLMAEFLSNLFKQDMQTVTDTLDRLLMLLMGDDYDRTFTDEEISQICG